MKKLMLLAVMAISINASAQNGTHPAWFKAEVENLKAWVDSKDEEPKAEAVIAKYSAMSDNEFAKATYDIQNIPFEFVSFSYFVDGEMIQKDKQDILLSMRLVPLAKAFDNPDYGNRVFPLYRYEGSKDATKYNPTLVLSIDANLDGVVEDLYYDPTKKENNFGWAPSRISRKTTSALSPVAQTVPANGNVAGQQGGGVTGQQSATHYIKGEDGNFYEVVSSSQNGNINSGNANPGGQKSNTAKTATVEKTITVDGPDDLVAQLDGDGQQGGGNQSMTEETGGLAVYQTEKGSGKPWYYTNPATGLPELMPVSEEDIIFQEMDGHMFAFGKDENGRRVPLASGKTNAYKNGMGEFAGYQANYYRHAANGAPLGSANARGGYGGNVQLGWLGGQMVSCPTGYIMGANNCWIPMVSGGGTVVGTTYMNRFDPVQEFMFKQNALAASQVSRAQWQQQNSYLFGH